MANGLENRSEDPDRDRWVDQRLAALSDCRDLRPDAARAWTRYGERQATARRLRRAWTAVCGATAAGGVVVFALPAPRAVAQRLWDRLLLGRVQVVQPSRPSVPESVVAMFTLERKSWDAVPIADAAEAEKEVGFRPSLPGAGFLSGAPRLSVIRNVWTSTARVRTGDLRRALAAAGVLDLSVPDGWDGITLTAEGGPILVADYPRAGTELMESAPFRMSVPPGFAFDRFMEIAFRIFGRTASDARRLGRTFAANPALLLHFPERSRVRDVPLQSGSGTLVDEPGGEGVCFFWNTADRIYIVSADRMTVNQAAELASSMKDTK